MSDERLAEIRREYTDDSLRPGERGPFSHHFDVVHELLREVERLRAPAQLGSALVEAMRGVVALDPDDMLVLYRDRDGVWMSGVSVDATLHITDATIAFDAALSALPVVEDAADHREEDNG